MTHYNLGVAYFQVGEWAKAAGKWRRALELTDFTEAKQSLDAALERLNGHELSSSAAAREDSDRKNLSIFMYVVCFMLT